MTRGTVTLLTNATQQTSARHHRRSRAHEAGHTTDGPQPKRQVDFIAVFQLQRGLVEDFGQFAAGHDGTGRLLKTLKTLLKTLCENIVENKHGKARKVRHVQSTWT